MARLRRFTAATLLFIALLAATGSNAGEIGISSEISSASIAFEEKDTLTVNLVWEGEPFQYQIDDFPMPSLEKLEILGSSSSVSTTIDSTVPSGEITTRTLRYILQPTDFGTGIINPLNLTAKNRISSESHELITGRLTVEIAKPVPRVETDSGGSLMYPVAVVIILVIGGTVIFVFIKKRRHSNEGIPADLSYIEALNEIKKETVSDRKLFYSRLYRLLLSYIEKEQGLEVSGKTGEEVVRIVGELEDDAEKAGLIQWLNQAQKVKYRPEAPSSGDVENSFNAVYRFFENKLHKR
jgi:hypothetical protein